MLELLILLSIILLLYKAFGVTVIYITASVLAAFYVFALYCNNHLLNLNLHQCSNFTIVGNTSNHALVRHKYTGSLFAVQMKGINKGKIQFIPEED